ncbi:MAG: YraN family protein [candidate division Zixibacteria bacterium]|nr:YraN family protein [candidate division Zixibacteria bacterium]
MFQGQSVSESRRRLGRRGEAAAEVFLRERGYRIIGRGWRPNGWKRGEIDLIAEHGDEVVFVEVKTRINRSYGRPEEAVDWRKQRQLRLLAWSWLKEHQAHGRQYRIDVIGITWKKGAILVRHLINAVGADG